MPILKAANPSSFYGEIMGRGERKDLDVFPLSKPSPGPGIVLKVVYYFLLIGIIIKEY